MAPNTSRRGVGSIVAVAVSFLTALASFNLLAQSSDLALDTSRPESTCRIASGQDASYLVAETETAAVLGFLASLGRPGQHGDIFQRRLSRRHVSETFYDTGESSLLNAGASIAATVHEEMSIYSNNRKQVVFSPAGDGPVSVYGTRSYSRKQDWMDKHPLWRQVKRKQRAPLLEQVLQNADIAADRLAKALEVSHLLHEVVFEYLGFSYGWIALDQVSVHSHGLRESFFVVRFVRDVPEAAAIGEVEQLSALFTDLGCEFEKRFANAVPASNVGYAQYASRADNLLIFRGFFSNYPLAFKLLQAVLFMAIGFLVLLLIRRRNPVRTDMQTLRTEVHKRDGIN